MTENQFGRLHEMTSLWLLFDRKKRLARQERYLEESFDSIQRHWKNGSTGQGPAEPVGQEPTRASQRVDCGRHKAVRQGHEPMEKSQHHVLEDWEIAACRLKCFENLGRRSLYEDSPLGKINEEDGHE